MVVDVLPGEPETFSFFGKPLYRSPMREDIYEAQKKRYLDALHDYKADPSDADNIIWLGRRLGYLGRYREACAVFSLGVEAYPEDPRFLRHRGHRFITLRLIDRAVEDFSRAVSLMDVDENMIEPDGIPNERGQPVSSLQTNVWYHLGLSYYLRGEYEKTVEVYRKGIATWDIPDNYVSFANWFYQSLMFLGRDEEANALLDPVSKEMDLVENGIYRDLLLIYKGELNADDLLEEVRGQGDLSFVGSGYGVAAWYLINKEEEKANKLLSDILSIKGWAGFGYIAAEAMYKKLGHSL